LGWATIDLGPWPQDFGSRFIEDFMRRYPDATYDEADRWQAAIRDSLALFVPAGEAVHLAFETRRYARAFWVAVVRNDSVGQQLACEEWFTAAVGAGIDLAYTVGGAVGGRALKYAKRAHDALGWLRVATSARSKPIDIEHAIGKAFLHMNLPGQTCALHAVHNLFTSSFGRCAARVRVTPPTRNRVKVPVHRGSENIDSQAGPRARRAASATHN
jgi:hypothetical protein